MKKVKENQLKIFLFTVMKNPCTLYGRFFVMSVKFSYVCFTYAEIFLKMSSGGLEVSFSI